MDHPEIVDFINWKVREEKKAHALIAGGLLERLQRRGLPHDQRPELEQLGPRDRRLHERRRRRAASGRRVIAHDRRGRRHATRRRTSGRRSPRPRGAAPIRACSTTRPSTAGTRARTRAHQRVEPVLRVHVPRRHGVQPVVAQPHQVPRARTASFDVDGYRHAVPRLLHRAGDPRRSLELPDAGHRARTATTTARSASATRTSARCSCCWASRTTRDEGRAIAAALTAIMCGHAYAASAEMAAAKGAFAGFAKNREPMLRVMRMHRDAAYEIDRDHCPSDALPRRVRGLGRGRRSSASSTATATRRPPCSRRPAPSASSWTATRRASSPTSRS